MEELMTNKNPSKSFKQEKRSILLKFLDIVKKLSMFKIQNGVFHKRKILHTSRCSLCLTAWLLILMLLVSLFAVESWGEVTYSTIYNIDMNNFDKY